MGRRARLIVWEHNGKAIAWIRRLQYNDAAAQSNDYAGFFRNSSNDCASGAQFIGRSRHASPLPSKPNKLGVQFGVPERPNDCGPDRINTAYKLEHKVSTNPNQGYLKLLNVNNAASSGA